MGDEERESKVEGGRNLVLVLPSPLILQMRKLRLREVKKLAQGHTVRDGANICREI